MGTEPERIHQLVESIRRLGSVVVAFSGGVDSSVVAALATRALPDRALAVTGVSAALATGELEAARKVAREIGIPHRVIETQELAHEGYRQNDVFRCYHCKTELYTRLLYLAVNEGFAFVLSGANTDDAGDWRPGLDAAAEHGIIHPLLDGGVGKAEVRDIARTLGVPSAEKPASPCLASRLPYGTAVTRDALEQVDAAEANIRALGFRVFRVRHHGDLGRIELAEDELPRAFADPQPLLAAVRRGGYKRVEIDRVPFRSGSLNRSNRFVRRLTTTD